MKLRRSLHTGLLLAFFAVAATAQDAPTSGLPRITRNECPWYGNLLILSGDGAGGVHSWPYIPDDILDFVVGSASVPVAVEPRRARLWLHGAVESFQDDVLTFVSAGIGLPDPHCQLRFGSAYDWILPCERI